MTTLEVYSPNSELVSWLNKKKGTGSIEVVRHSFKWTTCQQSLIPVEYCSGYKEFSSVTFTYMYICIYK